MSNQSLRWCLLLGLLLLAACSNGGGPVGMTPLPPTHTPRPSATPTPPAPTPTPLPRTLTLCMGAEPTSLYLYGDPGYAADFVRQAIYDGPIDVVGYNYEPVLVEKVPSLGDGDAVIEPVTVAAGTVIVDALGRILTLVEGVRIHPAGCRSDDCTVVFDGNPVAMDRMRVTFTLKPDLRWADGEPVTAQDSVYSFELASDLASAHSRWLEQRTAAYIALDAQTLEWSGLPGYLDPDYPLAIWTPLPEHAWRYVTTEDLLAHPSAARAPMGYGAYFIEEWQPGQFIRALPNRHYFRQAEGWPYFESITFRFVGNQNLDRGLDDLRDGRCDLLSYDMLLLDAWERLSAMDAVGETELHIVSGPVWEHLTFNVQPAAGDERPAFFGDVRARQAVAYCIDRQGIVDAVAHGLSPVPDTYVPPMHPLAVPAQVHPHSPDDGRALLDAIGWRDEDGDGVREAHDIAGVADGTPFAIEYKTTTSAARQAVGARVAEDLAACGIQVEVLAVKPAELFAAGPDTAIYGRRFDIAAFAWLSGVVPACELYHSSSVPSEHNFWQGDNVGGYLSERYDVACDQALAALPGEAAYTEAYAETQRVFGAELPALPLYLHPRVVAVRPGVRGVEMGPLSVETRAIEVFRYE